MVLTVHIQRIASIYRKYIRKISSQNHEEQLVHKKSRISPAFLNDSVLSSVQDNHLPNKTVCLISQSNRVDTGREILQVDRSGV